jgi:hypothetical protein
MPDTSDTPPPRTNWHSRDTSQTLICAICGTAFSPWKHAKGKQKYCSSTCKNIAGGARLAGVAPFEPPPIRQVSTSPADIPLHTNSAVEAYAAEWREAGEHWQRVIEWLANRRATQRRQITRERAAANVREGRAVVLQGFGAGMFVKNGQLLIKSGATYSTEPDRSEILVRGVHDVTDIIWITNGGAGSLSVAALKWCASQSITVNILTQRGDVLAVIHPTADAPEALGVPGRSAHAGGRIAGTRPDVALRRSQYALSPSGRDVEVARRLMQRKVAAQLQTAERHTELPNRERALIATSAALDWLTAEPRRRHRSPHSSVSVCYTASRAIVVERTYGRSGAYCARQVRSAPRAAGTQSERVEAQGVA